MAVYVYVMQTAFKFSLMEKDFVGKYRYRIHLWGKGDKKKESGGKIDYIFIVILLIIVAISIAMVKVNGSRFYNPFI